MHIHKSVPYSPFEQVLGLILKISTCAISFLIIYMSKYSSLTKQGNSFSLHNIHHYLHLRIISTLGFWKSHRLFKIIWKSWKFLWRIDHWVRMFLWLHYSKYLSLTLMFSMRTIISIFFNQKMLLNCLKFKKSDWEF